MKKSGRFFICQLSDELVKAARVDAGEVTGINSGPVNGHDVPQASLTASVRKALGALSYSGEPVVLVLGRNQATCRFIKIPGATDPEVDEIVALQAGKYLPYSPQELVTGYQKVSVDKDGYIELNLVIVQKSVIERNRRIFGALKPSGFSVALSSYGLILLHNRFESGQDKTVLVVDPDLRQCELAIAGGKKLLYSRAFRLDTAQPDWKNIFGEELRKTLDAYQKEVMLKVPETIVVLGSGQLQAELALLLNQNPGWSVKTLALGKLVRFSAQAARDLEKSTGSFAGLFGFIQGIPEDNLNLLPGEIKARQQRSLRRLDTVQTFLILAVALVLFLIGIAKSIDNKSRRLKMFKHELELTAQQAKPLEEMEKRFRIAAGKSQAGPGLLDMLSDLHRVITPELTLSSFTYEEGLVVLRGQANNLNSCLSLVSGIEKSTAFKGLSPKIRYATKKGASTGELVNFEIACSKE